MLDWLAANSNNVLGEGNDSNSSTNLEAPETPAPLFAVRALRSALFGTPSPAESKDTNTRVELLNDTLTAGRVGSDAGGNKSVPINTRSSGDRSTKAETFSSPAKGILLTPGTNKLQRKSVSFGASQSLRQNLLRNTVATGNELSQQRGKDSESDAELHSNRQLVERQKESSSDVKCNCNEGDNDVTIDLQEPRSRSGQHWKRQFSHYHMKSDHEMRALLKYTQNAKSFASRRDAETIDLKASLKTALVKVATMEARVSDLASQLVQYGNTSMDTEGQSDLVTRLAHQTTEVLRYKQKVDELENAARKRSGNIDGSSLETVILQNVGPHQLAKSADLAASHPTSEVQRALAHASSLEKENASLKKTILRVKEEMQQYEARHKVRREEWKRSTDKSKARQADLKERLRRQEASYKCSLGDLKATHAREIDDLREQLEERRGEKSSYSSSLQVPKIDKALRAETRAGNIKDCEGNRTSGQDLAQGYLRDQTAPGVSHRESTYHIVRKDWKTDKVPTGSESRADQIKTQPTGFEDYPEPKLHHKEHIRNSSRSQSAYYDHITSNQECRPSLPTQTFRHGYPNAIRDSLKTIDSSSSISSSRSSLPPNRRAAAQMRIEMRLASKQQSNAVGKENVRPIGA